ncbi:MAG TPA: DOMON-like domain-containing protein [Burkholderiales bacterium]|nr:DOMON-like domain-containing protein [Burkholderiales bacterium]
MPAERAVALACHPESRAGAVRGVRARVFRSAGGALAVAFTIEAAVRRLRVPPPAAPRFADFLWKHTCCEVFVARRGAGAYHEFNLAPSGEWAAYAFGAYRERAGLDASGLDPGIVLERSSSALELEATLRLERLSPEHARAPLALGLSAVIEDVRGALSYWALAHPPGRPDFHHTGSFALELE